MLMAECSESHVKKTANSIKSDITHQHIVQINQLILFLNLA